MAPTPVRMWGTRAPVANVLLATAMPTWPLSTSWAMIEKVMRCLLYAAGSAGQELRLGEARARCVCGRHPTPARRKQVSIRLPRAWADHLARVARALH